SPCRFFQTRNARRHGCAGRHQRREWNEPRSLTSVVAGNVRRDDGIVSQISFDAPCPETPGPPVFRTRKRISRVGKLTVHVSQKCREFLSVRFEDKQVFRAKGPEILHIKIWPGPADFAAMSHLISRAKPGGVDEEKSIEHRRARRGAGA